MGFVYSAFEEMSIYRLRQVGRCRCLLFRKYLVQLQVHMIYIVTLNIQPRVSLKGFLKGS